MLTIGLTDHLEGPPGRPSAEVFAEVGALVERADALGVAYAWFAEHHAHAHHGHLPTPLLYALHLAGRTRAIRLGTAVMCLNLRHPVDAAEQVAVADTLAGGRLAVGFGSGSTPEEFALFDREVTAEAERHAAFRDALRAIRAAWDGTSDPRLLPLPAPDLAGRCWLAVNSAGSARIAGELGFNMLFSHLRTPEQYRQYRAAYREAGGRGLVAANRPVYVGADDAAAAEEAGPALRALWRRFQAEGKIPADRPEPADLAGLAAHPINFVVGGPGAVARQVRDLREQVPFDVLNVEVRWAGLSAEQVRASLERLMAEVAPRLGATAA